MSEESQYGEAWKKELAKLTKSEIVDMAARIGKNLVELAGVPNLQQKVDEFSQSFERACRISLYADGSGSLQYSHPDGWQYAMSFESTAEFMLTDPAKLKEACNL